jgi:hypothetical protein
MHNMLLTTALALVALAPWGQAQSIPELFEKAVYTQETAGDVDRAIVLYRQLVSSPHDSQNYRAQAQYRLATCLLQKGAHADAAREFKKFIETYPEEKQLVESARESLLPLAHYLEADFTDAALGVSFTSPEWPAGSVIRNKEDGSIQVSLYALYDGKRFPYRVDFPSVDARRSTAGSIQAGFENWRKQRCPKCRPADTHQQQGRQTLRFLSDPYPNNLNDNKASVVLGRMVKTATTEVIIRAVCPIEEVARTQKIIDRISESVRMP